MRFTPPSRAYAGYIFDCDGTLVDSMPLHHRAWCAAFQRHQAPFEFDWSLFTQRAGMPLLQTVVELNAQFGCDLDPERVVAEQRAGYEASIDSVQPIDEVVAFARSVHRRAPMSVASGGNQREVEHSLRVVGIRDLFRCVVTAGDVTRGKPDPEMFLCCAEQMGVAPRDCLVIEDGALGIEAAERAGMAWARVADPKLP